ISRDQHSWRTGREGDLTATLFVSTSEVESRGRLLTGMLRFYTAGESHGQALLALLAGLPASLPVSVDFINHELHRRQLGYGRGGRQKIEKDRAEIFAGVRRGVTIGAPIALRIENPDWANWEKILPVAASAI